MEKTKYIFFALSVVGVIINFSAKRFAHTEKSIIRTKLIALAIVFLSVCAMFACADYF